MNIEMPILTGIQSAYDSIEVKDNGKIYITSDEGNIYLGNIRLGGKENGKTVKNIYFNESTNVFTIVYTDGEEKTIDLVLESVIQDIDFDAETKLLTFTLVSGATTDIDLSNLINMYEGSETDTTATDVIDGEITVDVKVSENAGNALEIKSDGLFVKDNYVNIGEGNIAVGKTDGGIEDSNRKIVSEISDTTRDIDVPDMGVLKSALVFGTF